MYGSAISTCVLSRLFDLDFHVSVRESEPGCFVHSPVILKDTSNFRKYHKQIFTNYCQQKDSLVDV